MVAKTHWFQGLAIYPEGFRDGAFVSILKSEEGIGSLPLFIEIPTRSAPADQLRLESHEYASTFPNPSPDGDR